MPLEKRQIQHIANLAHLNLSPSEIDKFASELDSIVSYFEKLAEIDTEGIPPFKHAGDTENSLREDLVTESLSQKEALANAPATDGRFFHVPKVIG